MNELESFEIWNKKKQEMHFGKPTRSFPKIRDVWIASVGKNIGYEQNGKGSDFLRPVLIIKKFNRNMVWVVPLTSMQKSLDFYYNYVDNNSNQVAAVLAQLKLLSTKRLYRKSYVLKEKEFSHVIQRLKNMLSV